jgi:hypothetical protein
MKIPVMPVLCVLVLAAADESPAQSTFFFRNYRQSISGQAFDKPVFDASGNRLFGTNYVAMLYGGISADALVPAVDAASWQTMAPVPFTNTFHGQAGYFAYHGGYLDSVMILTVPPAGPSWLQVRAWDLRVAPTYEAAVALGVGGYGQSTIFYYFGGTPPQPNPIIPSPLVGLESFSLVPEPSVGILFLLGLAGVLVARRSRKG